MIRSASWIRLLVIVSLLLLAGCGRQGGGGASLGEAVANTEQTLRDLLLGVAPERQGTARPDPPLLVAGRYEAVTVAADMEGFARVSRGRISQETVRALQERVVRGLDRDLRREGFRAYGGAYGAPPASGPRMLVATLVPVVEEAGSARDRAEGRGKDLILIRLSITDPATGATLVQRDYYSGRDVPAPPRR